MPPAFDTLPSVTLRRATLRALTDGLLPSLPTTALHGALGRALWQEVCLAPARPTCRGCPAEKHCPYPRLFEPGVGVPTEQEKAIGITDEAPRPLALAPEPPLVPTKTEAHRLNAGDRIAFRVSLAAVAEDALPHLVRALRRAARKGLGAGPTRVRFGLEEISTCDELSDQGPAERAQMHFLTPLRLKVNGRIQPNLDAAALVGALLRRAQLFASIEGRSWQPSFDPEGVATQLSVWPHLQVVPVWRFSNRQNRRMTWPGLVGVVELAGSGLVDLWPLLRFGERAQIGKATTFGFGRYALRRL
jgi:hypothetical protein